MDECKVRNPCKNGATCVNSVGGYSCKCPANYKGKHCDEGNINAKKLLETDTNCLCFSSILLVLPFVDCFASFIDVNECVVKNPCKNGANCENSKGGYKCNCVGKWFTGKHCDQGMFS